MENQLLVNRPDLKCVLPEPPTVVSQKRFFQEAGFLEGFFTESFKA